MIGVSTVLSSLSKKVVIRGTRMNETNQKILNIEHEVRKVIVGKDEIIRKTLMAILARGHVLLDDIPGVGKTTLALAFSKAMGLEFKRMQFTPDVVPSDIVGFSMYIKEKGNFEYKPGAAMCNFLLADEINRTSSKTQSALLEVMQEGKMTVDGVTHETPNPFVVIATQNPLGTAGTQRLPEAQMDRFMIRISIGYPDTKAQIELLKDRHDKNPLDLVKQVIGDEDVMSIQDEVDKIHFDDKIYEYITKLAEATRENELIRLGLSPRGALALCSMAKARAFIKNRDYVVPEDVQKVFLDVANHRVVMDPKSRIREETVESVLTNIIKSIPLPKLVRGKN